MGDKKTLRLSAKKSGVDSVCPEIPPHMGRLYAKKMFNEKLKKKIGIDSNDLLPIPRGAP